MISECFDMLAPWFGGSSSADIDQFVEWIRILFPVVELDLSPVQDDRHDHIFRHVIDAAIIEEIKRHAYDPPFECLTVDQRLDIAMCSHSIANSAYRGPHPMYTLDVFTARVGGEIPDLAIQTIFKGQHDVVDSLHRLMAMYGQAASEGDARVELQVPGILKAAIEHGCDLHDGRSGDDTTCMTQFLDAYLKHKVMEYSAGLLAQTEAWCSVFEKVVHDAVQSWLRILPMACVDLRLFWEEEESIEHFFFWTPKINDEGLCGARIIILEYGSRPEDWQVMTSWRLNRNIPEASAGDFWDMLDHPERQVPGFWDEELDSQYYYERLRWLWQSDRRYKLPNRHERRKGMLNRRFWDGY